MPPFIPAKRKEGRWTGHLLTQPRAGSGRGLPLRIIQVRQQRRCPDVARLGLTETSAIWQLSGAQRGGPLSGAHRKTFARSEPYRFATLEHAMTICEGERGGIELGRASTSRVGLSLRHG